MLFVLLCGGFVCLLVGLVSLWFVALLIDGWFCVVDLLYMFVCCVFALFACT